MRAAAGKVPPEEEEREWGSSEDWSELLCTVSWYVRTFSPLDKGRLLRARGKNERLGKVVTALAVL